MSFQDHRVRFDSSTNVLFDFKELAVECILNDTSYQAQGLMDMVNVDSSAELQEEPSVASLRNESPFSHDSKAQLVVPLDLFQELFLVKISKQDVLEDDYDHISFALDETKWCQLNYVIPFHNALVDPSFALNPNAKISTQNIQNDFVRSIYFDITGSLKFSSIFNNTSALLQNMKQMDSAIHSVFSNNIALLGGTVTQPLTLADTSNNPVRDFLLGMLGASNKEYRKEKLLEVLNAQNIDRSKTYVVLGTSFKGYGYYYPVYLSDSHVDLYFGSKNIAFDEYEHETFYVNSMTLNSELSDNNYPADYEVYVGDEFVTIPFVYGDGIQVNLNYNPSNSMFGNRIVHPRSYQVTMILGLENHTSLSFSDLSFVEQSRVQPDATLSVSGDIVDISGAFHFELLWLGSLDRSDAYFSHVHYYPRLDMVREIQLSMYVPAGKEALGIVFHCRPRVHENLDRVVADKAFYYIPTSRLVYDAWHVYSVDAFQVLLNDDVSYSSAPVFLRSTLHTTLQPFDMYFRGSQQILAISCRGYSNDQLQCRVKDLYIYFSDGHRVSLTSASAT